MGAFARLLADKGIQHETACLDEYELQGKSILRVSERERRESFGNWVARVGNPFGSVKVSWPRSVRGTRPHQ